MQHVMQRVNGGMNTAFFDVLNRIADACNAPVLAAAHRLDFFQHQLGKFVSGFKDATLTVSKTLSMVELEYICYICEVCKPHSTSLGSLEWMAAIFFLFTSMLYADFASMTRTGTFAKMCFSKDARRFDKVVTDLTWSYGGDFIRYQRIQKMPSEISNKVTLF